MTIAAPDDDSGPPNNPAVAVNVEVRGVTITPMHKQYLLNDTDLLFAYHDLITRTEQLHDDRVDAFDVLGLDATPFHFSSAGGNPTDDLEEALVARARDRFDALWSTIAEPFRV